MPKKPKRAAKLDVIVVVLAAFVVVTSEEDTQIELLAEFSAL